MPMIIKESWAGHLKDPAQNHDKVWLGILYEETGQLQFFSAWGRRGAALSSSGKTFHASSEARAYYTDKVREKAGKGYQQVRIDDPYCGFPSLTMLMGMMSATSGTGVSPQTPPPVAPVQTLPGAAPSSPARLPGVRHPPAPARVQASPPARAPKVSAIPKQKCSYCGELTDAGEAFCDGCGMAFTQPLASPPAVAVTPAPVQTAPQSASGLLAGRYRLTSQIGSGGMGAVRKAEDTRLRNRLVAIKEMKMDQALSLAEQQQARDAFEQEAALLTALIHPRLPRIYDFFSEGQSSYMVMDYIEGQTLEEYLAAVGGKLPVDESVRIGIALCEVLEYLHSQRPAIIFRDMKPANVMRSKTGYLYLIDFGIARHFKAGQSNDTMALGSPGYAAPEQYGKAQSTVQTDIYGLGATLHHILTGQDPSDSPFQFDLVSRHTSVTQALDGLVAQMVSIKVVARPQSVKAVRAVLEQELALHQGNSLAGA